LSDQPPVGSSAAGRSFGHPSFGHPSFGRPNDGRPGRGVGAESSLGDLKAGRSISGFSTERPVVRFNGERAVGTLGAGRSLRSSALEESPGSRPSGRRISADTAAPHAAGPSIGDAPAEQPGTRTTIYRWVDGKGTLHFSDRRPGEGQAAGTEVVADDSPVPTSTTPPRGHATSPGERDAQRGSHVTHAGAAHAEGSRKIDGPVTSGPHIGNAGWEHGFRHHRHHNAHRRPIELLVFAPFYPFLNFGYPYGYYPYPYTFDAYDGYGDYCDPNSPAYDPSRLGTYGDELICCSPYSPYYDSDHCVNADES
jgi:hypothetical protein